MDAFGLPMSFGKKSKGPGGNNLKNKLAQSKRDEPTVPAYPPARQPPQPSETVQAARTTSISNDDDGDGDIGPTPPVSKGTGEKRKADDRFPEDEESDDDVELEEEADRTPLSHEIVLKDHNKLVSAIAVDPSGARLATGSHDYDCKLWDFGGMDQRLRPFKSFEPNGTYFIHDLSYSSDGKNVLVISGTFYPKVFNRDGEEEKEFMKGDIYLRDMKNTKGHTAEINAGQWHPSDPSLFVTAANDSTLRIWDVNDRFKQKQVIIVRSKERGNRTHVTACSWSPDGKLLAAGCLDGAIHIWKTGSNYARPDKTNDQAHLKNQEITSVSFSPDSTRLVTRAADDTIKLWDVKSLRQPLAVAKGITNIYSETSVSWSPDGKYILAGTAVDSRQEDAVGELLLLGAEDLSIQRRVPIAKGASVVRVLWHSRINQIFCSLSNGTVYVLYSPHSSIRGALLPLAKMPRTKPRDISYTSADLKPVIYAGDGQPMYEDQRYGTSLHQKEKRAKKFKPAEATSGVGRGGRIGSSATAGFVQEVFANRARVGLEDPREALLRYATEEDQKKNAMGLDKDYKE